MTEDRFTTPKLMQFLQLLTDGEWHSLEEIQDKAKLRKNQIRKVIEFFERYGFICVDRSNGRAILDKAFQRFLAEEAIS